jgi:hypothetical protein
MYRDMYKERRTMNMDTSNKDKEENAGNFDRTPPPSPPLCPMLRV